MAKFYTPTKLSENMRETPEGFLLCLNVPIARTGWQEYGDGETPLEVGEDGIVRIFRSPEEVFRKETVASFVGKALTIKHPEEFVTADNWSILAKGEAHNVRKAAEKDEDGEETLLADLLWKDAMAIRLIKNGLREISCGYEAEYEQTGAGEGKQFNIIGNHVALVENGRAGSAYAITDHKRKEMTVMSVLKKLAEQMKLLSKTVDEGMAAEEKPKKASDEKEEKKPADKEEKSEDAAAYDELVKMVKDLGEKIEAMNGKKASDEEEKKPAEKEEKSKDDSEEEEKSEDDDGEEMKMEERLKALEAAVAKLLESKDEDGEEESSEDDDEEMAGMEDEEGEEGEESQKKKTGDAAKEAKKTGLEKTKDATAFSKEDSVVEVMTADMMNEINARHYGQKK